MKHMKVLNSRTGFTFIEVMVAFAILATVLTAVFRLHIQSIAMNIDARFYVTAPMLAQKKMAEIESDIDRNAETSGDFGGDFPGYTWKASVENVDSDFLGDYADRLKRIDVTVVLEDGRNTYDLRAYRFTR